MKKCPQKKVDTDNIKEIVDCDKLKFPWRQDPNGYFLVRIKNNKIECGFVTNEHKMILLLKGTDPNKIIKEIAKRKLVNLEHMGYIAQELQIVKQHLDNNKEKEYVQR